MNPSGAFIYGAGLFQNDKTMPLQLQLDTLMPAAFSGIVLWALHFQPNGDLHYNDTPAVSGGQILPGLNPLIPQWLQLLRDSEALSTVGVSIGPGTGDLQALVDDPTTCLPNLLAFTDWVGADFVDFDYEPTNTWAPTDTDTVTKATFMIAEAGLGVTYAPYDDTDSWIGCLQALYQDLGSQPVWWLNLQTYASGIQPSSWVDAIGAVAPSIGVAEPGPFINPGWAAIGEVEGVATDPVDLQADVQVATQSGVAAAWVWNTEIVFANESSDPKRNLTMMAYANALRMGLS